MYFLVYFEYISNYTRGCNYIYWESLGENVAEVDPNAEVNLEAVYDIPVEISVVLGKTNMTISQLLKMGRGAVIELDKNVGEPIDILVNNRLVAKGEVVIVENRVGITLTEIYKQEKE